MFLSSILNINWAYYGIGILILGLVILMITIHFQTLQEKEINDKTYHVQVNFLKAGGVVYKIELY